MKRAYEGRRRTVLTSLAASVIVIGGIGLAATPASAAPQCSNERFLTITQLEQGCDFHGKALRISGDGDFAIPAPGEAVLGDAATVDGSPDVPEVMVANLGDEGVAVRVGDQWTGSVAARAKAEAMLHKNAARRSSGAGSTVTGGVSNPSTKCSSTAYALTYGVWGAGGVGWYYNQYGAIVVGDTAFKSAAAAWTGSISACGYYVNSSAKQTYIGTTTANANITSSATCAARDSKNVVAWGALPANYLTYTCWWVDSWGDNLESDQKYATGMAWSSSPTCYSGYDLQGVATHEWGHTYGLTHVDGSTGQVMKGGSGTCEVSQRTLGHGDMLGIDWLY